MKKLMFAAVMMTVMAACGGNSVERAARETGESDARMLIDSIGGMSELQFESFLLNVRANGYAYEEQGEPEAAQAYLGAFEKYIKENSDSIASLIF